MTTSDRVERPTTATNRAAAKVTEGLMAAFERQQKAEWRATMDKLEALRQSFEDQRRQIIAPDLREKIKSALKRDRRDDPRGPGPRYRSLIEAKNAGVDLPALRRLHDRVYAEAGVIMKGDTAFNYHESVVGDFAGILERPPFDVIAPDPDKEKVFMAPYGGAWDRLNQSQSTGDGTVVENTSHLDGGARLGSRLIARNHDAADIDMLCAARHGGYLVPFTTLRTGPLQVKVDLTALVCRHHISTEDEWGWSDFQANTRGGLVMAVFWNWEDVNPASEVTHLWFIAGLTGSGDGESYPGTSTQALPGERRIINMFTQEAFPAGRPLWIYVGLADRIYAFLNDVSIDISIDSAWVLNSLAIRSV
jgi:hypothetical protein